MTEHADWLGTSEAACKGTSDSCKTLEPLNAVIAAEDLRVW